MGPLQKLQYELQSPENAQNMSACLLQEPSFAFSLWSDSIVAWAVDVTGQQLYKMNKDKK